MKKKSIISLFLGMTMVLSTFVGCGSKAATTSSDASKPAGDQQKKYKIGLSIDTTDQPWRAGLVRDVTEEAKKHPEVELIVTDGQGSSNKQISDVEDLITKKVDAILISPHEGQPLTPVCTEAFKAGIPVLVLDRGLVGDQFTTFIGANNKTIGKQAGEFTAKYLADNKLTQVVELQGTPGSSPAIDRTEPFENALSKNPGIKFVAKQNANWNENEALQVMENLLQAHPKGTVDVVYAECDAMALGALKAIKSAGRNEIKIVSIDGQKEAFQAIKSKDILGTFIYPFPGAEGVKTALKILKGEKVDKNIEMPSDLVTNDNVDKFYNPDAAF